MKKIYAYGVGVLLLGASLSASAQRENVGIGTTTPDKSAVLDIQSADKGLLIPRMTLSQRNNILQPAKGLMVYQTDVVSGFYYFDGTQWKPLNANEAKSVTTGDVNGWALDGNATTTATKAAATAASFIGTPAAVPINFKIGGVVSGHINPSGRANVTLGYKAGETFVNGSTGNGNVAVGYKVLQSSTGAINTGVGSEALASNTTGYNNTAIGYHALNANQAGTSNMAIGTYALRYNVSGSGNMAIGSNALENSLGSTNTAIGAGAGKNKTGNGNVYIGYTAGGNTPANQVTENYKLYIHTGAENVVYPLIKGEFDTGRLRFNVKPQVGSSTTLGFLALGDFSDANFSNASKVPVAGNGYRLYVQDGILTEKVKVALRSTTDWADYVFAPEYKLMSLEEVEAFTKANKHLPNVPSAESMAENGLDVSQTSKMFMEKIEELTLYMIEMNKQIKTLQAENEMLKKKLK